MTPEQFVTNILATLGIVLQLTLLYLPKFNEWYQNHSNKGLLSLAFSAVIGAVFVGLACSPFASELGITLPCDSGTIWVYLRAVYIIAISQQAAFLVLPKSRL